MNFHPILKNDLNFLILLKGLRDWGFLLKFKWRDEMKCAGGIFVRGF
jgi:hypothetical protein